MNPQTFALGGYTFSFRKGVSGIHILTVTGKKLPIPYQMVMRDFATAQREAPKVVAKFDRNECPDEGVFRRDDGVLLCKGGSSAAITAMLKGEGGWEPVPGGKHQGQRKKTASGYEYKYPSREMAIEAAKHHLTAAHAAGRTLEDVEKRISAIGARPTQADFAAHDKALAERSDHMDAHHGAIKARDSFKPNTEARHRQEAARLHGAATAAENAGDLKLADTHRATAHEHEARAKSKADASAENDANRTRQADNQRKANAVGMHKALTDGFGNDVKLVIRMHKPA